MMVTIDKYSDTKENIPIDTVVVIIIDGGSLMSSAVAFIFQEHISALNK